MSCRTLSVSVSLARTIRELVLSSATNLTIISGSSLPFSPLLLAVNMSERLVTNLTASAYSTGITDIFLPIPITSTAFMIFSSRSILESVSVTISMFVSA